MGIACGGWCPKGRRAEDGPIDDRYPLVETPGTDYAERTDWNVRDCDATLIISPLPLSGGTQLTARLAEQRAKPSLAVDPSIEPDAHDEVDSWLQCHDVSVLNVAGPRGSKQPDHYRIAYDFLIALLTK